MLARCGVCRRRVTADRFRHPLQFPIEVRRRLPSLLWTLGEAPADDVLQLPRHRDLGRRQHRWLVLQGGGDQAGVALRLERLPAGDHLVEHRPEREDVAARIGVEPFDLLGRHVLERAQDGSLHRQRRRRGGQHGRGRPRRHGPAGLGESEIQQLGVRGTGGFRRT